MDFRTLGTSLFAAGGILALLHSDPGTRASLHESADLRARSLIGTGSLPGVETRSPDQFRRFSVATPAIVPVVQARKLRMPAARPKPLAGLQVSAALIKNHVTAEQAALTKPPYPFELPHSSDVRTVERVAFAVPAIAGFLHPDGFSRPEWAWLSNAVQSIQRRIPPDESMPEFVVVLDAGHGGSDPGAMAPNGLLEKDLTLDIAKRVRLFLSEFDDIAVKLTREFDQGLSRHNRVSMIRRSQADVVLSLHLNHLPQTDLTLVESFYAGPRNIAESLARQELKKRGPTKTQAKAPNAGHASVLGLTEGSKKLATLVQGRVFKEVQHGNPKAQNAGTKQETLFVLTRSFTPGVLVEMTVLSNLQEAERLSTDNYRNQLAAALADSIRDYRDSLRESPLQVAKHDMGA